MSGETGRVKLGMLAKAVEICERSWVNGTRVCGGTTPPHQENTTASSSSGGSFASAVTIDFRIAGFCMEFLARSSIGASRRSEEHTSELQSQSNLVCRLLLEKKKNKD